MVAVLVFWVPEFRQFFDSADRIRRKGFAERDRLERKRIKEEIKAVQRLPWIRRVSYDASRGTARGQIDPRTWRAG